MVDQALQNYQRAATLRPDVAEIQNGLGNVMHRMHRHEEAVAAYYRAVRQQPDFFRIVSRDVV